MPSGIILKSSSEGATQEAVENVLKAHGHEIEEVESADVAGKENAEPVRDSFDSEEEFEAAHVDWQDKAEARKPSKSDEEEEEGEDEEEEEGKKTAVAQPRRKGKFARRLEKMVSPLQRENADLKARLEKLEKGDKADEPAVKVEPNPRPKRDDFDAQEKYEDALLAWGVEKKQREDAVAAAKSAEKETLEQNLTNYRTQVEEAKDKYDDWDEVVGQPLPIHTSVQLAIVEMENGAEVSYYLGRHPLYTKQLAEKSTLKAVGAIWELSEKLLKSSGSASRESDRSKATVKQKTKVPPPVRPVSTAATSSTLTSRDAATKRDYKAFKVAQRAGR